VDFKGVEQASGKIRGPCSVIMMMMTMNVCVAKYKGLL
jgi:hypothetical protein